MTRVTIPASTYLQRTIAPQGPVLTLPASGPLENPAAPFIMPQLTLPSTAPSEAPTESISPFPVAGGKGNDRNDRTERWARSGLVPRKRTWLFVVSSVLLVVLLIGTGWSVGMLQGLINASGATSLPGIGGIIATDDPTSTSTANPDGTATAIGGTPGATTYPQATTIPPSGSTATPTDTPQSMATATTAPPPALSYSDIRINKPNNNNTCTGTQTITNPGTRSVVWRWTNIAPSVTIKLWTVGDSSGGVSSGSNSMPQDTITAGGTDTLTVYFSCQGGATYTGSATDESGNTQSFHIYVGG